MIRPKHSISATIEDNVIDTICLGELEIHRVLAYHCAAYSVFPVPLLIVLYLALQAKILDTSDLHWPLVDNILIFSFTGKCDYVECKYSEWTNWNPACGKNMERKRTLQTIKKTTEKESCSGLKQTCTGDAEQTEKKDDLCK